MIQERKFSPGQLTMTRGVAENVDMLEVISVVSKHTRGDWGRMTPEDAKMNEWALENEARIFSAYELDCGDEVWVITEADRSSTCVLYPDEY